MRATEPLKVKNLHTTFNSRPKLTTVVPWHSWGTGFWTLTDTKPKDTQVSYSYPRGPYCCHLQIQPSNIHSIYQHAVINTKPPDTQGQLYLLKNENSSTSGLTHSKSLSSKGQIQYTLEDYIFQR